MNRACNAIDLLNTYDLDTKPQVLYDLFQFTQILKPIVYLKPQFEISAEVQSSI